MQTLKATRTLQLVLRIKKENEPEPYYYIVERLAADEGRAWRLHKVMSSRQQASQTPDDPGHYDVQETPQGFWECECKGHLRWGNRTPCKHVAGLRKLLETFT